MTLRKLFEEREINWLSPYAAISKNTKGRQTDEKPCEVRTDFQRDRDRIIHSKAFRRLTNKTQVFIAPEGDHYRNRLTHTLEVSQIARTAARALKLNEDLAEAISLGHDLGHTPFGHAGETALNEVHRRGFKHNIQSLRVVEKVEQGSGLNLTWEVRDGILNHTGDVIPSTLEGQIVKLADRIAYINHDIDDAIRANIISTKDLPRECLNVLGYKHSARINTMIKDLIDASWEQPQIIMSKEICQAMTELRQFLFDKVYEGTLALKEEKKAIKLVQEIYHYYITNYHEIPIEFFKNIENQEDKEEQVIDYIAGMTDRYAIAVYQKLFIPR